MIPQAATRAASPGDSRRRTISRRARSLIALSPLWYGLAAFVVRPGVMAPLADNPPGILGIAFGLLILGVAVILMLGGLALMSRDASTARVLAAVVVLTIPSLLLVAFGPAIVLQMQRLG